MCSISVWPGCAGIQALGPVIDSMEPGVPDELASKEDLQLANLDTVLIALLCVRAFWTLKAAVLGASSVSETGPLDTRTLFAVVSSFKKGHPELWATVQSLGALMPGLLSSEESQVVEHVNWSVRIGS